MKETIGQAQLAVYSMIDNTRLLRRKKKVRDRHVTGAFQNGARKLGQPRNIHGSDPAMLPESVLSPDQWKYMSCYGSLWRNLRLSGSNLSTL
jgi:hypothetical protein